MNRKLWLFAALVLCCAAAPAEAARLKTIHVFCKKDACLDGQGPSKLISDGAGNLFGATLNGGPHHGDGTIFELVGGTKYKRLYGFCAHRRCGDGRFPTDLIIDTAGNLYGTTFQGGTNDDRGTIFELSPNADQSVWTLTTLHDFCAEGGLGCTDGANPAGLTYTGAASGAPYDGVSPLYGATSGGGGFTEGVVYKFTPAPGHRTAWSLSVLHVFCTEGGFCSEGRSPSTPLLLDASGNLFGTTNMGGIVDGGTVFELSSSGTFTVLHKFCSSADCTDGQFPDGALIQDAAGNLYGTTEQGGLPCRNANSDMRCGVVYKVAPAGTDSVETVLHAFCADLDCPDGAFPHGAPIMDAGGVLYGPAQNGGGHDTLDMLGSGTVFRLSGASFHVLHAFCALAQCADGAGPGSLSFDAAGRILGGTGSGGAGSGGTVFRLTP